VSYDLYMLAPDAGGDPMGQITQMEGGAPRAPDPGGEAQARRVAEALRAADQRYEQSEFEFEGATAVGLIADGGLEITLWPDHASFNVPYWESLDADRITRDIATAASVIAGITKWRLYDPQLERFVDPQSDTVDMRSVFDYGRERLSEMIDDDANPVRRNQRGGGIGS
jgi:hypothetical protein